MIILENLDPREPRGLSEGYALCPTVHPQTTPFVFLIILLTEGSVGNIKGRLCLVSILEPPIGIKSPCLDASQDRATKSSHGAHHNALAELGYAHILPRNTNILKYTTFILLTKILFLQAHILFLCNLQKQERYIGKMKSILQMYFDRNWWCYCGKPLMEPIFCIIFF